MAKLHYVKANNLSQLHDEILSGCSAICPIDGQAQMSVEGDGNNVWLTLPDNLSPEDLQQVEAIVASHTPKAQSQPNWVQFRAQVSMHSAYLRLVVSHPQNGVLNDLLVPLLWGVGNEPELLPEVAAIWNAMENNVALTETEILQLNAIAAACHVPLRLTESGMMEVQ